MNAEDLLADLATALSDPDGIADPVGMLGAWAEVVRGEVGPDTRYGLVTPTDREATALAIVSEQGAVTSGDLAKACYVHPETARLTLAGMVERGLLRAEGRNRGRRHTV